MDKENFSEDENTNRLDELSVPTMDESQDESQDEAQDEAQNEAQEESKGGKAEHIHLNFVGHIKMGNVQMTQDEFVTLRGKEQLEDQVIYFFMEYYRTVIFGEYQDQIGILGPALFVYLMNLSTNATEAEWFDNLQNLNLMQKRVVLIVVHQKEHWTLLAFVPPGDFYHMDSLRGVNKERAKEAAGRFKKAFNLKNCQFFEKEHITQGNGYDCGLLVIRNTIKTLEHLFTKGRSLREQFAEYEPFDGQEMRAELLRLVQDIANQRQ